MGTPKRDGLAVVGESRRGYVCPEDRCREHGGVGGNCRRCACRRASDVARGADRLQWFYRTERVLVAGRAEEDQGGFDSPGAARPAILQLLHCHWQNDPRW